ncbi:hypothetical protein J7438_25945, partial [Thalassotalea sp. G20_0]|uniref:hypothetical protein n=1 Tax=Thalassotalea sp. G20_0 TaxID=2821093 RepID=UPI001ADBBA44
ERSMLLPYISRAGVVRISGSIGNGGVAGMNGIFCRVSGLVQQEHPADGARRAAPYAGVMRFTSQHANIAVSLFDTILYSIFL